MFSSHANISPRSAFLLIFTHYLMSLLTTITLLTAAPPTLSSSHYAPPTIEENCNHQGFNIILRGGEWLPAQHGAGAMRLGMYTNEQDDCSTCDSYRGIGYDKPAGASCSFGGCGSCDGVSRFDSNIPRA